MQIQHIHVLHKNSFFSLLYNYIHVRVYTDLEHEKSFLSVVGIIKSSYFPQRNKRPSVFLVMVKWGFNSKIICKEYTFMYFKRLYGSMIH